MCHPVPTLYCLASALHTQGIIQALRDRREALVAAKMRIFVRRGGPNYEKGLALMRALGGELGLSIQVGVPCICA